MKNQPSIFFILTTIIGILFLGCEAMATLFHGEKPEPPPVTYTVTFDANGANGTLPETQTVNDGEIIRLPGKGGMSKGDDIFAGWNENVSGSGTSYPIGASVTVTKNMVFYAQWLDSSTPQYMVTFNANGATSGAPPSSQTVYSGVSITIPGQGTLAYSGKTFGGWNTQANGGGTNYETGAIYTVTGNVTLYAKWQSAIQYTVAYNANGASGTAPAAQKVDPGTEITLSGAGTMTYTGRKFTGWNSNAGGTGIGYAVGDTYTVTGNVTLYAQWQSQSTVTYSANGASGTAPSAQTVDPGTEITLPGAGTMTYIGRKFIGWNTQANGGGTSYEEGAVYTVNGNVTLYAKWQSQCTVTFNANGASGTAPSAQTVDPGTVITLPDVESMIHTDGKKFSGWNTKADGTGDAYNANSYYTPNGNITLYAKWVFVIEGLSGVWKIETYADKEDDKGNSTIEITVVEVEKGITACYAFGYMDSFTGFKAIPDEETLKLLKTATSFSFKVRGDGGRYYIKILTSDITDNKYYQTEFETIKNKDTTIEVDVSSLKQPIWGSGNPHVFNQNRAWALECQPTGKGIFALKIWDIQFYQ